MGYSTALSGLNGASQDLDVIGNNIANANTVGFKGSTAQFADMYANSLATSVNNQIGIGTQLSEVQQDFSNGNITSTGRALDVAISGNGFFQLSNNGSLAYSRNGVFHLDPTDGSIENTAGLKLLGYAADSTGKLDTSKLVPLSASNGVVPPTKTSSIKLSVNLNAQDSAPSDSTFSASDPNSYNYAQPISVYDSLGGTHSVTAYFVKNSTGSYDVYGASNNGSAPVGPGTNGKLGTVSFNTAGAITSPSPASFSFTIPNGADNGATTQALKLDLTGTTQYGSANTLINSVPDGNSSGTLQSFSIGSDGVITGVYTNQQTLTLGQVPLATFANNQGLADLGGNLYAQTAASGTAQVSVPGSTQHGTLQGGATEDSNVDLTSALVDLIAAQRNYQANAQTIKTQQTVDQTLINL